MHDVTSLPNAEATGLGPSRRVILWDTLVDGRFSDREVDGRDRARARTSRAQPHLEGRRLVRALRLPGTFLIARATRRRGGMSRPEAVPLSLLVLVGLTVLAQPIQNVVTRHMEAEADWSSLQATHDPARRDRSLRALRPHDAQPAEPADVGLRDARESPDDHAAHRDGAGLALA